MLFVENVAKYMGFVYQNETQVKRKKYVANIFETQIFEEINPGLEKREYKKTT